MNAVTIQPSALPQSQGLLSNKFWNKHFNNNDYAFVKEYLSKPSDQNKNSKTLARFEKLKWIKDHSLKFVILHQKAGAETFIERLAKNNSPQIHSPSDKFQLTPLHIAVMTNQVNVVKSLVQHGADILTQDVYSWTPLHHAAALPSNEIYKYLKQVLREKQPSTSVVKSEKPLSKNAKRKAANRESTFNPAKDIYTKFGANCKKIRELLDRRRHPVILNTNVIFINEEGQATKITEKKFEDFTYSDECSFPMDQFIKLWKMKYVKEEDTSVPTPADHRKYKAHFPHLYIKQDEELKKLNIPCQGAYAGEKMPAGTLLGEYTGTYVIPPLHISFNDAAKGTLEPTYLMEKFDAKNRGNSMKYFNDGWPNCCPLSNSSRQEGLPQRHWLVVTEKQGVEEDEQLFYDYGNVGELTSLKWGKYILHRKEQMKSFFEQSIQDIIHSIKQTQTTDDDIQFFDLVSKIRYFFHTPAAMIYIILGGTMSAKKARNLLDQHIIANVVNHNRRAFAYAEICLNQISTFESKIESYNVHGIKENACQFLIQQLDKLTAMQLFKGMVLITQFAEENKGLELEAYNSKWEKFQKELIQTLSEYDFTSDKSHPIQITDFPTRYRK